MKRLPMAAPIRIDRGIDKIIRAPAAEEAPRGPSSGIVPSEAGQRPRLDQMYALPSLEDYMARELQPGVAEAALLLPGRFNAALEEANRMLLSAAEGARKDMDERNARSLARAARLLSDQVALRDLLHAYRNALLQG